MSSSASSHVPRPTSHEDALPTHKWGTQPEMFGPRHEYRLAMFLRETASLPKGSKILDGAIGLGQLAGRLVRQGHRVFGVDSSFEAALHAKRTSGANPVVGDMTLLPFRDGTFDAATSGETLEHLDDDEAAVAELARVIRPDGLCVVTVPALQSLWTKSDDYYEHRRRYGRQELAASSSALPCAWKRRDSGASRSCSSTTRSSCCR
jgi:ubiquinone/menaquinone biosynthesis C-methylase UbiE